MQRPRRTSEFHEEPGTATKHLSRQPRITVGTTPVVGTAQKYTRQTRLRPPSLERVSYLPVGGGQYTRNATPQKTPLSKPTPVRLFLTAEKQRAQNSDKKWIQEQTQRITDYLKTIVTTKPGSIANVGPEFFNRNGGLRQMSIKQFVAIVNYFLQFICGSRFIVGSNHVDDISNILQKINYPHQVNKSWLKTPNTQHSFGYVIVLLDYLMDFAMTELEVDTQFPLQEPPELTASNIDEEMLQIPDIEFQDQMMRNSEEGFTLWDKQLMQDFLNLQKHICDVLIQKRTGVKSLKALEAEIKVLQSKFDDLKKRLPPINHTEEEICQKLEENLKSILQHTDELTNDSSQNSSVCKQLQIKHEKTLKDIKNLEAEIAQLQNIINKQKYTVEQRDKIIEDLNQLKHIMHSHERTVFDLRDRNHNQQVLLSRAKKQITDQIEKFNAHMRELTYSQLNYRHTEVLQLPLIPTPSDIENIIPHVKDMHKHIENRLQEDIKKQEDLQQQMHSTSIEIQSSLQPRLNSLQSSYTVQKNNLKNQEELENHERSILEEKIKNLLEYEKTVETLITNQTKANTTTQNEIDQLKQKNEYSMSTAEQIHQQSFDMRMEFLNKYKKSINETIPHVEQLQETVNYNANQLQLLKKENETEIENISG